MLTKEKEDQQEDLNPSDKDYHQKFDDIAKSNPDIDARGDQIEAEDRDKRNLKDKEQEAESSPATNQRRFDKNGDAADQYGYYNEFDKPGKPGLGKRAYNSFKLASNWKKGAGVGGVLGVILGVFAFFTFLGTFQLVHLTEQIQQVLGAQSERVHSTRAAKHYRIAADVDGKSYFNRTGVGRLGKAYSALDPEFIHNDLRKKGYDIEYNKNAGRVTIDGNAIEGKLSDRRNVLRQIIDTEYPDDGWLKRNMRSRTAFKAYGIQRVFFENTKERIGNWELEMIKRLRTKLNPDGSQKVKVDADDGSERTFDTENGDTAAREGINTDAIAKDAEELRTNLEDPSYNPDTDPKYKVNPDVRVGDIDVGRIAGGTAVDVVKVTGAVDAACEAKYFLYGIELGAIAIRNAALIRHYSNLAVAAHQIKNGQNVTASQINSLMIIFNRNGGIGKSGAFQLLNGRSDAKVTSTDKYGLSFTNSGGAAGLLSALNSKADGALNTIFGEDNAQKYCKLSRNIFYQGGSLLIGLGQFFVPGANAAKIANLTVSVAIRGFITGAQLVLQPILTQMVAGGLVHYYEDGSDQYDAFAAGGMYLQSATNYQNGLNTKLTDEQRAETEQIIAYEKAEDQKDYSFYKKYVALDNPDSFLAQKLGGAPTSAKNTLRSSSGYIASLPGKFAEALGLFTPHGYASAQSLEGNPLLVQDPFGAKPYGMSERDLRRMEDIDPVQNEEWIYANGGLTEYQEWVDSCFPEDNDLKLSGLPLTEDDVRDFDGKCAVGYSNAVATSVVDSPSSGTKVAAAATELSEKYFRYTVYRIDRNIQQKILFMSQRTDCTDPDSEDWDCIDDFGVGDPELLFCGDDSAVEVASFNVLGAAHTGGAASGELRMVRAYNELFVEKGLDVIGLQEFEPPQRKKFLELAQGKWGIHPDKPIYGPGSYLRSSNSIVWRNDMFDKIDSGYNTNLEYWTVGKTRELQTPWVKLRHKQSGEEFVINNTHDPINRGDADAKTRAANARDHLRLAGAVTRQGTPFILTGDFNSREVRRTSGNTHDKNITRDELPYCILTSGNPQILRNAYDHFRKGPLLTTECPTKNNENGTFGIDHIYHSPDVKITNWKRYTKTNGISDHPLVYSTINFGEGSSPSTGTEPKHDYSRITYNGAYMNARTKEMLQTAEKLYGKQIQITQGSYNAGGVRASGGTHDGGGALDVGGVADMSPSEREKIVKALRQAGFAAWLRIPSEGGWSFHIHAIAIGDKELAPNAQAQVQNYFDGLSGLVGNAPDRHLETIGRPIPAWAEKYGDAKCSVEA